MSRPTMLDGYLECTLWSSMQDDGTPLDRRYSIDDLAPEAMEGARRTCAAFEIAHADTLQQFMNVTGRSEEDCGHDLWLTRNGHGAGFWDCTKDASATVLTAAAEQLGECDLIVGDDELLYFEGGNDA